MAGSAPSSARERASIDATEDANASLPEGSSPEQRLKEISLSEGTSEEKWSKGIKILVEELVKLEMECTAYVANRKKTEEERANRKKAEEENRKQKIEALSDHVTPYFSSSLTHCQQTLMLLLKFMELKLSYQRQENHISKWTVEYAKGMLSEIQQDLEQGQLPQLEGPPPSSSSKKMTLDEYLQKTDKIDLCFANIRLRGVLSGIQLSELLVQYMFSLSNRDEEERLEKLGSMIKKLAEKARAENNNNNVAEKFVLVMDETNKIISSWKQFDEKNKKMKVKSDENLGMETRLINHICSGISVLGFVLCDEIVPESSDMVEGVGKRIEVILGLMLYNMQEIRISIGENNPSEYWKIMKDPISWIWGIEKYRVNY